MLCKAPITGDQRAQILRCKSSTASIGVHIKFSLLFFFTRHRLVNSLVFYKNKTISAHNTTSSLVKGRALHTNGGTFYVPFDNENDACVFVVCQCCHITYAVSPTIILQPPSTIPFFGLFFRSFFCALSLCTFYTFPAPEVNQLNLHHVRAYTTYIVQD